MNRVKKVKQHVVDHKEAYIAVAGCLVVGTVVGLVCSGKAVQIVDSFKLQICSPTTNNISQTTILARRGHPGNIIRCNETGELFASQNRAASLLNLNSARLSEHLNGMRDHVAGLTFENLGEAK